jgi:hypothetical protein
MKITEVWEDLGAAAGRHGPPPAARDPARIPTTVWRPEIGSIYNDIRGGVAEADVDCIPAPHPGRGIPR